MSIIPKDVILIHVGSNASIPSGWARETTLDAKFAKGWGDSVAPDQTGGATTHTHTSSAHSHAIAAHTHTYTLNSGYHDAADNTAAGGGNNFSGDVNHNHTGTSGAASGSTSSDAVTYAAASNNPPYRKVIFIKANVGAQLATDIVALWGTSDTAPSNWSKVTELSGRYLLGASTGADADLTTDGGSTTNVHSIDHTHSTAAHTHVGASSSGPQNTSGQESGDGGAGGNGAGKNHTHSISMQAATLTATTTVDLTASETVEPAYRRLHAIKKGATGLKEKGIIGMWLGASTAIPKGWSLYTDMKDKHLKIGDPTTSATGGSNTHTHAAAAHTHTGGAHNHTSTNGDYEGIGWSRSVSSDRNYLDTHTHTTNGAVSTTSADWGSANTAADSSNNEPAYRTVAFIKFDTEIAGGGALALLSMMT